MLWKHGVKKRRRIAIFPKGLVHGFGQKLAIFPKWLIHGFGPKIAIFQIFFFLGKIGQENILYNILERENAFLGYKN